MRNDKTKNINNTSATLNLELYGKTINNFFVALFRKIMLIKFFYFA